MSKKKSFGHTRTKPSVLNELKEQVGKSQQNTQLIYKSNQNARDAKQIANLRYLCNKNGRFPLDEVNNCVLMSVVDNVLKCVHELVID